MSGVNTTGSLCTDISNGKTKMTTSCDPNDPDRMEDGKPITAEQACQKIKKLADKIDANSIISSVAGMVNPAAAITALGCAIGSCNKETQSAFASLNAQFSNKQIQNSVQECKNLVNITQTNYYNDAPCLEIRQKACEFIKDRTKDFMDCLKMAQNAPTLTDKVVNQGNTFTSTQMCVAGSITNLLSSQSATLQNTAILSAIQKATGFAASNNGTQDTCVNMSTSMSSCQYIMSSQCCSNQINAQQSNTYTSCGGGALKVDQTNSASVEQKCFLSTSSSMTNDMAGKIANLTEMASQQTAIGLDPFLMLGIIIAAFVLGVPLSAKYLGNAFKYALIVLFLLGGIVLISVGVTGTVEVAEVKEQYVYDSPFAETKSTKRPKTENPPGVRIGATFEEAKKSMRDSKAFDFILGSAAHGDQPSLSELVAPPGGGAPPAGSDFYKIINGDPKTQKKWPGNVVYYSSFQMNDKALNIKEQRSISYIPPIPASSSNPSAWMIWAGAGVCILDLIILAIVGIYVFRQQRTKKAENTKTNNTDNTKTTNAVKAKKK